MRDLRDFQEFVKERIVRKSFPDISRANFLQMESEKSYSFLQELVQKLSISDNNANSIVKLCYDILMELVRAEMLKKGYKSSGQYSHEAEVSFLRELRFTENETLFVNQLRYFRNSVTYYGKILNKEYAKKVFDFLVKVKVKFKTKK